MKDQIDISLERMFDKGYILGVKKTLHSLIETMKKRILNFFKNNEKIRMDMATHTNNSYELLKSI